MQQPTQSGQIGSTAALVSPHGTLKDHLGTGYAAGALVQQADTTSVLVIVNIAVGCNGRIEVEDRARHGRDRTQPRARIRRKCGIRRFGVRRIALN